MQLNKRSFILSTAVVAGIFFGLSVGWAPSCTEEFKDKDAPLGKQVSPDEVLDVIIDALQGNNFDQVEVGSAVLYESNMRVELGAITTLQKLVRTVSHKETIENGVRIVIDETLEDYTTEEDPVHRQLIFDYLTGEAQSTQKVSTTEFRQQLQLDFTERPKRFGIQQIKLLAGEEIRVTYHDLKVERLKFPVPTNARGSNCQGIPNCEFDATQVEYNEVTWKGSTIVQRFHITEIYTPQIPYMLTPIPKLSECINFLHKDEARNYYLNRCLVLRDFQ